ncbi:MAG: PEP-CTERM sorting domain-containing protein [Aureliella sp.]
MSGQLLAVLIGLFASSVGLADRAAAAIVYNVHAIYNENFNGSPITDSVAYALNDLGQATVAVSTAPATFPYQHAVYSPATGYQVLGNISNNAVAGSDYINNSGVVVGGDNNGMFRYENGVVSHPDTSGLSFPSIYGLNNAGVAWGSDFNDNSFWFDGAAVHAVDFNNNPSYAIGVSDAGIMAITDGTTTFVHALNSNVFTPLADPAGYSGSYIASMTNSGLLYGDAIDSVTNIGRAGFWNSDGSFDHFFSGSTAGLHSIFFNELGHAIALNASGLPVLFDGTSWNDIETGDLQGATFRSINDFNNLDQFVGSLNSVPNTPAGYYVGFYASQAVPEPSSVALLGLGSLCALVVRRRTRCLSESR